MSFHETCDREAREERFPAEPRQLTFSLTILDTNTCKVVGEEKVRMIVISGPDESVLARLRNGAEQRNLFAQDVLIIEHDSGDQAFRPDDMTPQERMLDEMFAPRKGLSVERLLQKALTETFVIHDVGQVALPSPWMGARREELSDHPKGPPKRSNKLLPRRRKGFRIIR